MNTMVIDFLIQFYMGAALYYTPVYLYFKTSVHPIGSLCRKKWFLLLSGGIVAALFSVLYSVHHAPAQFMVYFAPSLVFSVFEKDRQRERFLICFLLSSVTRVLRLPASGLIAVFLAVINPPRYLILSPLIIYTLMFLLAFFMMKLKRFRRGFQFFQSEDKLGMGLAISGLIFFIEGLTYLYRYIDIAVIIVALIGLFIVDIGLYLWIRHSITAHYRERLQLKSDEHYEQLLREKESENEKLSQSNAFLAKIVHRDNHLIGALGTAVDAYFQSGDQPFRDDLLRELQTLARERDALIKQEQRDSKILPPTGSRLIDSALNDLYIKAAAHGIDFDVTVSSPVSEIIGKYISQTDLQTLLCDHIKDAVIAVEAAKESGGKILVELSEKSGSYTVSIFDNGVPFAAETLARLGRERVTTHADSGGSGIGFMTTFETLRKTGASLMIAEFEPHTPFSKAVSVLFNGENAFIIRSYRSEALKKTIQRDDILFL